ncbi:MAG: GntR family transcriptional regulator [Clostridia bacterium]|nr:GntR family transcriptional regulator [Clostridia bacterium]
MNYKAIAEQLGPRVGATQEWVFQVLRRGIVNGDILGGTQLKQDEISSALNVSHIPVREALRRLESQGLVTIHPNRGAQVTQLTRETLLDMMEVRATLSAMLLKNGGPLLMPEDYAALEANIACQKQESDPFRTEELNIAFHDILSSRADNDVAKLLLEIVHANIDRYLRIEFYSEQATRDISIRGHEALLDLCRAGDFERACELLKEHIMDAKAFIPEDMR